MKYWSHVIQSSLYYFLVRVPCFTQLYNADLMKTVTSFALKGFALNLLQKIKSKTWHVKRHT
jgi:hypothetical protein